MKPKAGMRFGEVVLSIVLSVTWLLLVGLAPAGAITTSGQITGEETWSGTVRLTGDVTVTSTGKLTILPGTKVECTSNSDDRKGGVDSLRIELIVNGGTLIAKGNTNQRIMFTSAAAKKDSANWYGLRFIGASISTVLQYCTVQYGVNGISVERGALVNIEQWVVENCNQNGVSFVSSAILTACTIRNNGKYGVSLQGTGRLSQCTVSGNVNDGVHGASSVVIDGQSRIEGNAGDGVEGTGSVIIDGQSRVEGNTGDGVKGGSVTAKESQFLNNKGNGVSSISGGGTLTACTIRNNIKYGVLFQQTGQVNQCTVSDNGDDGVHGTAGYTTVISGQTRIENNTGDGFEGGSITAWNSHFLSNKGHGINISSQPTPVEVVECTLESNGKTGLGAWGGDIANCSITIRNTTVRNNVEEGLLIWAPAYWSWEKNNNWQFTIEDNTLESNGKSGLSVATGEGGRAYQWKGTVHKNTFNGNNLHGFYLSSQSSNWDVSMSENTLVNNGGSALFVESQGAQWTLSIRGNDMRGNGNDAITVSGARMPDLNVAVTGNTLQNNAFGVNITGNGTCTADITNNTIQVSGRSGIYVAGAKSLSIHRNKLQDNIEIGIHLVGAPATATIDSNTISGGSIYGLRLAPVATGVREVIGIEHNNFMNEGLYVFYNESAAKVIAPNNYWGSAATKEMDQGKENISAIYDSLDNNRVGKVVFKPYSPDSIDFKRGSSPSIITHRIALQPGWNLISSFVQPQNSPLDSLLRPIIPNMVIMKNGQGQVFWPIYNTNTIGQWNPLHGYLLYMQAADTLAITGTEIAPEKTPLPLVAGWNLIAYLRNRPMSADSALVSMVKELGIAKTLEGKVYWPAFGVNDIGAMRPGRGYYVYLSQAATLTYPANSGPAPLEVVTKPVVGREGIGGEALRHYRPLGVNTGATAILLAEAADLRPAEEVGVWTSTGWLIGSGVIRQGRAVVTLWGDNHWTEDRVEGAVEGEELRLTGWSVAEQREREVTIIALRDALRGGEVATPLHYQTDAVWVAQVTEVQKVPTAFRLEHNTPNPFNPSTVIRYGLPHEAKVRLEVYDLGGQRVAVLVDGEQKAGSYEVVFQTSSLASGVYFYRLQAGEFTETRKMLILR